MGWERKRGKLHELNRLLRGATDTTFMAVGGPPARAVPAGVRYVITLDADTRLPRETAAPADRQDGASAQPPALRRRARGRVVEGYAVLQPRVTPSLPIGREGSLFQRIFSSPSGIDPYAAAVSDVYQDLFGEGSYTGKGIYDVDAFEAALAGRVPENTLLSHDLFEGIFARAGLASDIEVVEEFPARYDVAAARQHRWARGDWQLLPWISAARRCRRRPEHERAAADRPLEDARQPAPVALGAGQPGGAGRRLDAAAAGRGRLDGLHPVDDRVADAAPGLRRVVPRRARDPARSHLRALAATSGSRSPRLRCSSSSSRTRPG